MGERTVRVIIAGGRDFDDFKFAHGVIMDLFWNCAKDTLREDIIFVSGGAKGADAIGERIAATHEAKVEVYPADWDKYGKAAGAIRNQQMALTADELVAFWDGRSAGTKNMIEKMVNAMKPTHIYFYKRKK